MQVQHLHAFALRDHLSLDGVVFQVLAVVIERCPLRDGDYGGHILHVVVLRVAEGDCEVVVQVGFEYHGEVALHVLQDEHCVLLRAFRFLCLRGR